MVFGMVMGMVCVRVATTLFASRTGTRLRSCRLEHIGHFRHRGKSTHHFRYQYRDHRGLGKTGTETTPDYASNDPAWNNNYHGVQYLNEISTVFVSDSGVNSFHGQVYGDAINQTGLVGDGLYFDGSNDYVSFGVDAGNPGTASFTTSFWVKWTGSGDPGQKFMLNNKEENAVLGWSLVPGFRYFWLEGSERTSGLQIWEVIGVPMRGTMWYFNITPMPAVTVVDTEKIS